MSGINGDLELENVVKLFDRTLNEYSRDYLKSLFYSFPLSPEELADRRNDLQLMVGKSKSWGRYFYSPVDFKEVYHFLNYDIKEFRRGPLFRGRSGFQVLEGRVMQVIIFFEKVEQLADNLADERFSQGFSEQVQFVKHFIRSFLKAGRLEKYRRGEKIGYADIVSFNNWLYGKHQQKETERFYRDLTGLERYLSISLAIGELGFVFPALSEGEFELNGYYYPMLNKPVRNDFKKNHSVILLTGANMAGKSTFLKAISLCLYLGNLGLPVPAGSGVVPLLDRVLVSIHHKDDIKKGYSHFMNELVDLRSVIVDAVAGLRCFAVFDEIFSGTSHSDAVEILSATLKGLGKFGRSLFIISTHLDRAELDIESEPVDIYHLECRLVDGRPVYSYKTREGWSDVKVGCILYEEVGIKSLLDSLPVA